jgi:hypothetical protein
MSAIAATNPSPTSPGAGNMVFFLNGAPPADLPLGRARAGGARRIALGTARSRSLGEGYRHTS